MSEWLIDPCMFRRKRCQDDNSSNIDPDKPPPYPICRIFTGSAIGYGKKKIFFLNISSLNTVLGILFESIFLSLKKEIKLNNKSYMYFMEKYEKICTNVSLSIDFPPAAGKC